MASLRVIESRCGARTTPEWVYVQYATAMIGAIQVNINPAYRTSELEFALRQSGSRMLGHPYQPT